MNHQIFLRNSWHDCQLQDVKSKTPNFSSPKDKSGSTSISYITLLGDDSKELNNESLSFYTNISKPANNSFLPYGPHVWECNWPLKKWDPSWVHYSTWIFMWIVKRKKNYESNISTLNLWHTIEFDRDLDRDGLHFQ